MLQQNAVKHGTFSERKGANSGTMIQGGTHDRQIFTEGL